MKKSLGNISIIFILFFSLNLFASPYEWSATTNKKSAYVNEAILLKYVCKFSDKSELYTIDFHPVRENEHYTIELLRESEKIVAGKRVNSYEYIAYVKHSGKMVFDFDMVMKKTTQESIDSTTGGRDNDVDKEVFVEKYLRQKSIHVNIKRSEAILVGEFELEVKYAKVGIKAYESYNLEFIIKGVGNFEKLNPISFKIDGVKVFFQKTLLKSSLKKDGKHGIWSQKFAFVSDKSFIIPAVEIEYFDIKKESKNILHFDGLKVEVLPAYTKIELLDEEPKNFELKLEYLYYLLTFILGFIVAKINFKKDTKNQTKKERFCQRVKNAKTLEELNMLLVVNASKKYAQLILEIEKGELTSLNAVRKLICD